MKVNYLVIFDDGVEAYCRTEKAVKETIDEMVEMYSCRSLSERTIRKDTEVYRVVKIDKLV